MFKLIIDGELPSLNDYIRSNRSNKFYANKIKQDTQNYICHFINQQLKGVRIDEPVYITYNWYCKDKKKDKDNICFAKKFIQDSLVESGVLKNDGWNDIVGFKDNFYIDKGSPRIKIIIDVGGYMVDKLYISCPFYSRKIRSSIKCEHSKMEFENKNIMQEHITEKCCKNFRECFNYKLNMKLWGE